MKGSPKREWFCCNTYDFIASHQISGMFLKVIAPWGRLLGKNLSFHFKNIKIFSSRGCGEKFEILNHRYPKGSKARREIERTQNLLFFKISRFLSQMAWFFEAWLMIECLGLAILITLPHTYVIHWSFQFQDSNFGGVKLSTLALFLFPQPGMSFRKYCIKHLTRCLLETQTMNGFLNVSLSTA